ncbi:hypothetical protein HDC94_002365 [Leifsonia sp. AK011]|uniref:PKD domain-containing protein n=1 Tax=Leifsonia sp. AK011 TaxID=2723075 RepID=UPI0015CDBBBD|nr:hypothetical protein [Leifsonia sp. AK011]NYF11209.1 hypothetical protein [Leifsonia sp. AK011]
MFLLAFIILATSGGCGDLGFDLSLCTSGSIGSDSVTLDGTLTAPGTDPDTESDRTVDVDGGDSDGDPNTFCMDRVGDLTCWSVTPPTEAATAPITLADIAQFRPVVGDHVMEPDGWAVAGLPANVWSGASVHSVDGTLLGGAATVRFTPVAWRWDYGDGSRATLATGGSPWTTTGGREFSATPTSHVFAREGTFGVTLTVDFRAEYRVGSGGWIPIAGTLAVPAPTVQVTVARASTVLVQGACSARPRAPGCR